MEPIEGNAIVLRDEKFQAINLPLLLSLVLEAHTAINVEAKFRERFEHIYNIPLQKVVLTVNADTASSARLTSDLVLSSNYKMRLEEEAKAGECEVFEVDMTDKVVVANGLGLTVIDFHTGVVILAQDSDGVVIDDVELRQHDRLARIRIYKNGAHVISVPIVKTKDMVDGLEKAKGALSAKEGDKVTLELTRMLFAVFGGDGEVRGDCTMHVASLLIR